MFHEPSALAAGRSMVPLAVSTDENPIAKQTVPFQNHDSAVRFVSANARR